MAKEKEPLGASPKSTIAKEKKATKKNAVLSAPAASPTAEIASVTKKQPSKTIRAKAKTKSKSAPAMAAKPTLSELQEAIRLRAYEIYLQRAGQPGNPHEDWSVL